MMRRSYGGTAGGGKSDRRGNVTYSRVVPKFLQKYVPDAGMNPLDAKRGEPAPAAPQDMEDEPTKDNDDLTNDQMAKEIEKLKAEGFNVIVENTAQVEPHSNPTDPVITDESIPSRLQSTEMNKSDRIVGAAGKKPISKTRKGKEFITKNKHKLSFANSDSDSSD